MKIKALIVFVLAFSAIKAQQYDKPVTFNVQLVPVFYRDIKINETIHQTGPGAVGDQHPTVTSSSFNSYGGLHVEAGVAINKRHHISLVSGFESTPNYWHIPAYVDYNVNFMKTRFSPYFHVGVGFSEMLGKSSYPNLNGYLGNAGLGFYAHIYKWFAASIGPDYRFLYNRYSVTIPTGLQTDVHLLTHQIGFRVSVIFY